MSKIILIEKIIGLLNDSFREKPLDDIDRKQQIWSTLNSLVKVIIIRFSERTQLLELL